MLPLLPRQNLGLLLLGLTIFNDLGPSTFFLVGIALGFEIQAQLVHLHCGPFIILLLLTAETRQAKADQPRADEK